MSETQTDRRRFLTAGAVTVCAGGVLMRCKPSTLDSGVLEQSPGGNRGSSGGDARNNYYGDVRHFADRSSEEIGRLGIKVNGTFVTTDFSRTEPQPAEVAAALLRTGQSFSSKERLSAPMPTDTSAEAMKKYEKENIEWWPTHCQAIRSAGTSAEAVNILDNEYRPELVYLCQDGPFFGAGGAQSAQSARERHWWALISQPNVTMVWPIVQFFGEFVWFEWLAIDDRTHEVASKGSVFWVRRGHAGCYCKGEQLTFFRDVYAPQELLNRIR